MEAMIGATIALISKSEIRYVGTLQQLDQSNATVSLQNVRSYGTEGRIGDPSKELPPSPQVFSLIMFKGSDIKDLTVLDTAQQSSKAPGSTPPTAAHPIRSTLAPELNPMQQNANGLPPMPFQGFPPHQHMPFPMMPLNMNPYMMQQAMSFGHQSPFWPQPPPNMSGFGMYNPPPNPIAKPESSTTNANTLGEIGSAKPSIEKDQAKSETTTSTSAVTTSIKANTAVDSISKKLKSLSVKGNSSHKTTSTVEKKEDSTGEKLKITSIMDQKAASSKQQGSARKQDSPFQAENKQMSSEIKERSFDDENKSSNEKSSNKDNKDSSRSHHRHRGGHRGHHHNSSLRGGHRQIIPKSDFDFERSNAKFHKEELTTEEQPKEEFYQKTSFFDDISCDMKDRQVNLDQNGRRAKRHEERRLNFETFGQASAQRGRGGRGGRGHVGRGGSSRNHNRHHDNNTNRSNKKQEVDDSPGH